MHYRVALVLPPDEQRRCLITPFRARYTPPTVPKGRATWPFPPSPRIKFHRMPLRP